MPSVMVCTLRSSLQQTANKKNTASSVLRTVVRRPLSYFSFPFRSQVQINDDWFTRWIFNTQPSKRKQQQCSFDHVFGHVCRSDKCNFHLNITSCCRYFARKLFSLKGSSKMHFRNIFIVAEHIWRVPDKTSQISRHLGFLDCVEEKRLGPRTKVGEGSASPKTKTRDTKMADEVNSFDIILHFDMISWS